SALLKNPSTLVIIAIFSVTFGPLMEELFFRGLLYPVLARGITAVAGLVSNVFGQGLLDPSSARRLGVSLSVVATGLGFALVHASQYGNSWALVSMLFLVGLVLGSVRAAKNSVAAGFLVHVAYNGVLVFALVAGETVARVTGHS